jgi:hypothetical protein
MQQIAWMGSCFRSCRHREFILFSILPALAVALVRRHSALDAWLRRLQRLDRWLLTAVPALGRYCWETVITFER